MKKPSELRKVIHGYGEGDLSNPIQPFTLIKAKEK